MKVLHVFADTNVFLQCKKMEEVDWSVLGDYDRVDVLVTHPVIREVDSLKKAGNERRAARSRTASARFRSLMNAAGHRARIIEGPRIVELCLRQDLKPLQPAPIELDYESGDDRLVGTMLAFCRTEPDVSAVLLTHDNGPAMSARSLGLRLHFVPDDWLLPPESTDSALKAKLDLYQKQEPRFEITMSHEGSPGIQATLRHYQELTERELLILKSRLKEKFPLSTDFGSTEPQERPVKYESGDLSFTHSKDVYEPATREAIDGYKRAYAKWQEACTKHLQGVHRLLHIRQDWPCLKMAIDNTGSRPAIDALVMLEIQGSEDLSLLPPRESKADEDEDDDDDDDDVDAGPLKGVDLSMLLKMQAPPPPPKGAWRRVDAFTMMNQALLKGYADFDKTLEPSIFRRPGIVTPPIDPNEVYFKQGGRGKIDRHIEYSCQQWRHAQPARNFDLLVVCPQPTASTYLGVIRVEVHASNLTQPEVAKLPFKLSFEVISSYEEAKKLVEDIGV